MPAIPQPTLAMEFDASGTADTSMDYTSPMQEREPADKPFTCAKCGAGYLHFQSLWRHRRKCEGTYRVSCALCEKQYHRKDHCLIHLRRVHHITDRPEDHVALPLDH
ncbi:hypothetical protein BaRGS_00027548 [Batillaria attramentaria]|uniref:C2H2-type domain-containing protein n=1 Tax=Batillaria attramentaria TaxID=370345 RepID=A0ABD0K364_9CAEN